METQLQFFKTFLLPYFDYCLSIGIYYNIELRNELKKLYYFCLRKLLIIRYGTIVRKCLGPEKNKDYMDNFCICFVLGQLFLNDWQNLFVLGFVFVFLIFLFKKLKRLKLSGVLYALYSKCIFPEIILLLLG